MGKITMNVFPNESFTTIVENNFEENTKGWNKTNKEIRLSLNPEKGFKYKKIISNELEEGVRAVFGFNNKGWILESLRFNTGKYDEEKAKEWVENNDVSEEHYPKTKGYSTVKKMNEEKNINDIYEIGNVLFNNRKDRVRVQKIPNGEKIIYEKGDEIKYGNQMKELSEKDFKADIVLTEDSVWIIRVIEYDNEPVKMFEEEKIRKSFNYKDRVRNCEGIKTDNYLDFVDIANTLNTDNNELLMMNTHTYETFYYGKAENNSKADKRNQRTD